MARTKYQKYHYYVEGENEKKLLSVLKTEMQLIIPGKIEVFNIITNKINISRIMRLSENTVVVLVFDTDVENTKILNENITFLKKQKIIKQVLCIPQVKKLEDEIMRSCSLKSLKELTSSKTEREFKVDFMKLTNLQNKLETYNFNISKLWSIQAKGAFEKISNDASKIKK